MLRIGETIDRYRVEALIGQGGMAAVYRARHVKLHSQHAIKVLFVTAPVIRKRLLREGRVQANLRHPNIVSVTDVLEVQGAPALVMEYVNGPALDQWLVENQPTLDESLWLYRWIVRGIAAAHERGVVHRDLKPANILLAPTNEGIVPKVTDFGLVKSIAERRKGNTQTGMALGTPEYMSPEQIRDASEVDTRADMWALGCILYELVCHRRAFSGPDKMSTFNAIVAGTYEPPRKYTEGLPRNVSEAIRVMLEVDRDNRLSSCVELFDLLFEDNAVGRLGAPHRPTEPLLGPPSAYSENSVPYRPEHVSNSSPLSFLLDEPTNSEVGGVPTDLPAGRRAAVPTGLRFRRTALNPERSLGARSTPLGWLIALVAPMLLVVGVAVGVGVARLTREPTTEPVVAPPTPGQTAPSVVSPAPPRLPPATPSNLAPVVAPELSPAPAPAAPAAVAPPSPAVARPLAGQPAPKVIRVQPVAAATATVRVVGDARAVWLTSGGTRFDLANPVEVGTYEIWADFGGDADVAAGSLALAEGDDVELRCSSFAYRCTVD